MFATQIGVLPIPATNTITVTNPIITENQRKEGISYAYLTALAAWGGHTVQPGPNPDMDSVDATVRNGPPSWATMDIQLKATARADVKPDGLHFRLKKKNYNDLVEERRTVPLLLVVFDLPADESEWIDCTPERLIMRRCGWWLSLAGQNPMDAGSATVVLPPSQRIGTHGLGPLFAHVRDVP